MYHNFTDSEIKAIMSNFKNKYTKEDADKIFKEYWKGRVIMIDNDGNEIPQLVWC
jgi:hypothetical protein